MHDDVIDALASTPAVIIDLVESLDTDVAHRRADADDWSTAEIVGHIRAAATIWHTRLLLALVDDGVAVPDVDERALQELQASGGLELGAQVTAFALARTELTGILRSLSDAEWSRSCLHQTGGRMTIVAMCSTLESHEREHLEQLRSAAARAAQ
jgi:hypothetical protein